jgi:DNA-binding protein H-NS
MTLTERARDLKRQLTLLDGHGHKGRDGVPTGAQRVSGLRGVKVAPKYRGPGGETWAGRGARPRWLSALVKEGHSIEEFLIGAGRTRKTAAAKKRTMRKKGGKRAVKARRRTKNQPAAD